MYYLLQQTITGRVWANHKERYRGMGWEGIHNSLEEKINTKRNKGVMGKEWSWRRKQLEVCGANTS